MSRWRALGLALIGAVVACRGGGEPAKVQSRTPVQRVAWLEDALPDDAPVETVGGPVVAVGIDAALAGHGLAVAALRADRGLVGYLRLPVGTRWVGLGAGDEVLAATVGGDVFAADSLDTAVRGEFRERGRVPDAVVWDAALGLVAAAGVVVVHVSTDGGRTFTSSQPTSDPIADLLVRPPATVVAIAGGGTGGGQVSVWISSDAGRTWQASRYARPSLNRFASWITDAYPRADFGSLVERCPAVLAADGTWRIIAPNELAKRRQGLAAWPEGVAAPEPWYRAAGRPLTLAEPIAVLDQGALDRHPCRTPRHAAHPRTSPPPPPPLAAVAPPPVVRTGQSAGRDDAIQLVDDEPFVVTATAFGLADDGVCALVEDGACRGVPIRTPHVVVWDQRDATARVTRLPEGCVPVRLLAARGLGVLLCRGPGEVHVYTIDRAGHCRPEASFPAWAADLSRLSIADDGTILVTTACTSAADCRAVVRNPLPAGAPAAWWTAAHRGAVGYRVVAGGQAVAIEAEAKGDAEVSVALWRLERERPPALAAHAVVPAPLESVVVRDGPLLVNGRPIAGGPP